MPTWNPSQYLKFADQRTRPARDLVQAVLVSDPRTIADLGCGPGNSTAVCRDRWPEAAIVGIDHSKAMIEKARDAYPEAQWQTADIAAWSQDTAGQSYEVLFSNAALHWVDDHQALFPRLLKRLASGGALAVQMPSYDMPPNRLMREVAADLGVQANDWRSHPLDTYYEILRPRTAKLDLWTTEYVQVMDSVAAIVDWYRGSGLRPYLDAIDDDIVREAFVARFAERLRAVYIESPAGGVLFPFRRTFLVAYVG